MSRTTSLWSLFNTAEKHRIDDLPLNHVLIILPSIPPAQLGDWVAWRPGERSWQSLDRFPEFEQTLIAMNQQAAAADAPLASGPEPAAAEATGENFSELFIEPKKGSVDESGAIEIETNFDSRKDRRRSPRFKKDWVVEIRVGNNRFVSKTADISLRGLRVRDPFPDWLPLQFQATLLNSGHSLTLFCSRLSRSRNQARIEVISSPGVLSQWLMRS